ncbi:MAG: bifunctional glutamate N-acetyltransferase/amino-acid acetyltransferase ArgJ [Magnetococcales bacterium]|nr:bifunctional glutamate N-acetyltransferase/amino-acid acetyltransferase ArgJ [Magnetococcales bacterium]
MALALPPLTHLLPVPGFTTAVIASGIKANGDKDLLLVSMVENTTVAGLFTQNRIVAAPVTLCRVRLPAGVSRALIVNSGNANVANGPQGMQTAKAIAKAVAEALNVPEETVFTASTGVIGEALPMEKPIGAIPKLTATLNDNDWLGAAQAIMTTDTQPKAASRQIELDGKKITITGIAKGAGMIHPNMATMLAFLFTDAAISPSALQTILGDAVETTFNSVTVDGDTSTNDTLLAFASGLAENSTITDPKAADAAQFAHAINDICLELAQLLVRDGEGVTKFITITVAGAKSEADAKKVAMSVAKSPLVKTAFAGCDPNWGRILCAIGYAGVEFPVGEIDIFLGEVQIVKGGVRAPDYRETQGQEVMNREEITVLIDLKSGHASRTIWSCDLTHEYIKINADYRS